MYNQVVVKYPINVAQLVKRTEVVGEDQSSIPVEQTLGERRKVLNYKHPEWRSPDRSIAGPNDRCLWGYMWSHWVGKNPNCRVSKQKSRCQVFIIFIY